MRRARAIFVVAAIALSAGILSTASAGSHKPSVAAAAPDIWIILTGTVESVEEDYFTLDYGDHDVGVMMRDWNSYNELKAKILGKSVTVSGVLDKDFGATRTILANSVYLDGRYYYANRAGEESGSYTFPIAAIARDGNWITARGVVKDVRANSFTLGTRRRDIQVDVTQLPENPLLKDNGLPRVRVGDTVSVYGRFDVLEIFDPRKIRAHSVAVLVPIAKREK